MNSNPAELTELEQVKLENFALRNNALQQQLQANLAARAAFIKQVEAAHPGYQWDETKGLTPSPSFHAQASAPASPSAYRDGADDAEASPSDRTQ